MKRGVRIGLWGSGMVLLAAAILRLLPHLSSQPGPTLSYITLTLQPTPLTTPAPSLTPIPPGVTAPSASPSPTPQPASPTPVPVIAVTSSPTSPAFATLDFTVATPATAVPTHVPPFSQPGDVINILLLGNDVEWAQGGRTDSLILVSLNQKTGSVTLLSFPRDLYVYIPGWKMERINLALPHGHGSDYPGGGGQLIKDTLLYNFGIPVDYYIRIGFEGFKQAVDLLGGIELVVNCPLTDWRLKSPELDPEVEENWEQFTLETGIQEMDGDLALWYVRSRKTTNDFERGRRQQQILRALLQTGANSPRLLTQLPEIWSAYQEYVETDMPLTVMIELATLMPTIQSNTIRSLTLAGTTTAWQVPVTREMVQLPQWQLAQPVLAQLMVQPELGQTTRPPLIVEVVAPNWVYFRQVAENLAWYGIGSVWSRPQQPMPDLTQLTYYGVNFKGSGNELMARLFYRQTEEITLNTDPTASPYRYQAIIGKDYNVCQPLLHTPNEDTP